MENQKPGPGPGSYSVAGTGTPTGAEQILFDHEKLEVYVVAREFLEMTYPFLRRKMSRSLREQFERASLSIVANIAEGAGKTSRADKQRLYEIGRGSTTETAALLDAMRSREAIAVEEYQRARSLLIRVKQMLSRLSGPPRST
ncbi:MAG: four helix bundle protein [Deltaproteobacteria bacterium]|nr:MAG: four helix bundle protein [Deltaproteobacteria bacterium]